MCDSTGVKIPKVDWHTSAASNKTEKIKLA